MGLKLSFMAFRFLVMEFNSWKLCGGSMGTSLHSLGLESSLKGLCWHNTKRYVWFSIYFSLFFRLHIYWIVSLSIGAGSSSELVVEDEGDYDAAGVAESTIVVSQPLFTSLVRLGVQISAVLGEILDFFRELDRVTVSQYRPQQFWVFDGAEVEFHGF